MAETTTPQPTAAPAPEAGRTDGGLAGRARSALGRWEGLLLGLIVVTLIAGAGLSEEFLSTDSFTTGSLDFSEVALMALALTLVIVAAEIDVLGRRRVQFSGQVTREDRAMVRLVAQLDANLGPIAIDELRSHLPTNQRYVVAGHQQLRRKQ